MLSFESKAILERVTIPILFLYFLGMLWLCCFFFFVFVGVVEFSVSVFKCFFFFCLLHISGSLLACGGIRH